MSISGISLLAAALATCVLASWAVEGAAVAGDQGNNCFDLRTRVVCAFCCLFAVAEFQDIWHPLAYRGISIIPCSHAR